MKTLYHGLKARQGLTIYHMRLDYKHSTLCIRDDKGETVSFKTKDDVHNEITFLENAVSAFLNTNPSGFRRIICSMHSPDQMAMNYNNSSFRTLLEEIEGECTMWITSSLTQPNPFFCDSDHFRMRIPHYPLPDFKDYIDFEISSYYPPVSQYWVIRMSKCGIITICDHRDAEKVMVYNPKPRVEKNELLLTPDIFIKAMRNFIELDFDGFGNTVNGLRKIYNESPNSWNIIYWQLCLMETVYRHFCEDIIQASAICPWISYD